MNDYIINIEKAVLSSILFNGDEMEEVSGVLKPKDFYFVPHQKVFEVMIKLHKDLMPIDEEFIRKKVNQRDVGDNVLLDILSANPITNTSSYVKEIKDYSIKRELASLATTIKKVTFDENINANEALTQIENQFYNISNLKILENESIDKIVERFKQNFNEAATKKGFVGLQTGINKLDNILMGMKKGQVVAIGARPSMGKSSLAFQIAQHNVNQGFGVVIDSLEMPSHEVIMRILANKNEESLKDLQNGLVKNYQKYHETLKFLSINKNLVIHDKAVNFNELKSKFLKIKKERDKKGLDTSLWIIDHIGYVNTGLTSKREELTQGTKMLKQLAKDLNIVVMPLSQLNRDLKGRRGYRPLLSDFKETGSLEEDCDIAIFPHRDSYYAKAQKNEIEPPVNPANLLILKNRNGPTGVINLDFNGPFNKFGYYPQEVIEFVEIPEI